MNPLLLPLMLLVLFSPFGIDIFLTSIPTIQQTFGTDTASAQLTISLFVLAMGVGQVIVGPLADRFGRRPVALAGIGLYLVSSLLIATTDSFVQLLVWRMLQGLGACATAIVAFSVVRDRFDPRDGARIYSYLNGSLNVVPAMAPLLGGALAQYFGWHSNFYFLAVFALVVLAVIYYRLPETRPTTTSPQKTYSWRVYRKILGHRQFGYYALCSMAAMGMVLCYVIFSTQVLIVELGVSSETFALLFGANALLIMCCSFLSPKVINRIGRRRSVTLGGTVILLAGVLMACLYLWQGSSALGFMVPVALACAGFSLQIGSAASLALEHFPDEAGTAAALHGCFQMLGASLISLVALSLPLSASLALAAVMVAMGGFAMLGRLRRSLGAPEVAV